MNCIVHGLAKSQTQLSNFHFHCSDGITQTFILEGPDSVGIISSQANMATHAHSWF